MTTLLLALGLDQETILNTFYHESSSTRAGQGWKTAFRPDRLRGQKLTADLVDAATGQTLAEAGTKMTPRLLKKIEEQGMQEVYHSAEELVGRYLSRDLINEETGLVLAEAGDELTGEAIRKLAEAGITEIPVLDIDHLDGRPLHPQHAGARPLPEPRGGAARHLPRAAPGRAADAGHGRGAVRQPDLRLRALRPVARSAG